MPGIAHSRRERSQKNDDGQSDASARVHQQATGAPSEHIPDGRWWNQGIDDRNHSPEEQHIVTFGRREEDGKKKKNNRFSLNKVTSWQFRKPTKKNPRRKTLEEKLVKEKLEFAQDTRGTQKKCKKKRVEGVEEENRVANGRDKPIWKVPRYVQPTVEESRWTKRRKFVGSQSRQEKSDVKGKRPHAVAPGKTEQHPKRQPSTENS